MSLDRARSELEAIAGALAREYPATNGNRTAGLRPLQERVTVGRREPLFLLTGATSLLLLIACANVAGLLLARALGRTHEFAIRASLGAGTARLTRQFLLEAAVLAASGAALGLVAADIVLRAVPRFVPSHTALTIDAVAFGFAVALAAAVTLFLGAASALLLSRWGSYELDESGRPP